MVNVKHINLPKINNKVICIKETIYFENNIDQDKLKECFTVKIFKDDFDTYLKYVYQDESQKDDDMSHDIDMSLIDDDDMSQKDDIDMSLIDDDMSHDIDMSLIDDDVQINIKFLKSDQLLVPSIHKYKLTTDKTLDLELALLFLSCSINKLNNYLHKPIAYPVKIDDLFLIDLEHKTLSFNSNSITTIYPNLEENILIFIPVAVMQTISSPMHHFNIIIIDKQSSTYTYYEPYGYYNVTVEKKRIYKNGINTILKIIDGAFKGFSFIDPHKYDEFEMGVQRRAERQYNMPNSGYCVAWCTYICYLRLFNYHLKSTTPMSVILNRIFLLYEDAQLLDMIMRFVEYIKHQFKGFEPDRHNLRGFFAMYDGYVDLS
jgi:hypothetical protein